MCLLLLAWKVHPRYELLVAANRDEHHARPTAPLDYWLDIPGVVAGRDLVAAGTWLGTLADGRFATVTNFRDEAPTAGLRSRGELVMRYFDSGLPPDAFASALAAQQSQYAGFNLIAGDREQLIYVSNRAQRFAQALAPGLHGLSNHELGTPWPKVTQGLQALRSHVDSGHESVEPLFDALLEQKPHPSAAAAHAEPGALPWPASSGPFISREQFGTRATTLLWRDAANHTCIEERRFAPLGVPTGRSRISLS